MVLDQIVIPFEDVTTSYCGSEKFDFQITRNVIKNLNSIQSLSHVATNDQIIENSLPWKITKVTYQEN